MLRLSNDDVMFLARAMPAPLDRALRDIGIHPTVFLRSLLCEAKFCRSLQRQQDMGIDLRWSPAMERYCAERTREQASAREAIAGAKHVQAWTAIPFMGATQVKAWEMLAKKANLQVFCHNTGPEGVEPYWVVQASNVHISSEAATLYLKIADKLSGEEAAPSSRLLHGLLVSQMVEMRFSVRELKALLELPEIEIYLYVSRRTAEPLAA